MLLSRIVHENIETTKLVEHLRHTFRAECLDPGIAGTRHALAALLFLTGDIMKRGQAEALQVKWSHRVNPLPCEHL